MSKRFLSLDGWRAVGILCVLASHATSNNAMAPAGWRALVSASPIRGDVGVSIFFCLSGFLITSLLFNEETVWLGTISSSVYLRQQLVLDPTAARPPVGPRFSTNIGVGAGALSCFLCERWFLALKNSLIAPTRASVDMSAPALSKLP